MADDGVAAAEATLRDKLTLLEANANDGVAVVLTDDQQGASEGLEQQPAAEVTLGVPSEPASASQTPSTPSSPPKNDYLVFKEMLKHPSALPVTAKLQDFVRRFPSGLSREQAASHVHKFLTVTQDWMLSEVVVFAEDTDEEARLNAAEGLEKFLLSRLHGRIFAADPADRDEDALLQRRIDSLSWITFTHLGIPPVDTSLLALAVDELQKIDNFKVPRDKLVCVLNSCLVINDVLKRALVESGSAGRPLSADDFLPMLIIAVVLANPPRLQSNVEFVAAFRHPSRLV
ncbi:unnamed protein product, partial [Polarella glacialis]